MKKIHLVFIACLFAFNCSRAVNVAIIESQSGGHGMDGFWQATCTGLGYTATIYPQTQLDVNTWFGATDFLIVSSGVIALPQSRINTIQAYLAQGGRVYLQSEYDCATFTTNGAFEQVTNALGGSFHWQGISAGQLVPMNVTGSLSTTPNAISPLGYYWYGCSGLAGCNSNVEPFMENNGLNFGFIFCVPGSNNARMITTSDQDWILNSASPQLMQNIAINLANSSYTCAATSGGLGAIQLGNDTAVCNGGNVLLNGTSSGSTSYQWSTGASTAMITVSTSGIYWVNATNGSCTATDTIQVNFGNMGTLNLGNDTAVCSGALSLNATTTGATSYLWSTGSTVSSISASQPGQYWVHVSNSACAAADTIQVSLGSLGALNLGNDTTICTPATIVLNGTVQGATAYIWSTGATTASISVSAQGTYWVNASNGACSSTDTIQVSAGTLGAINLGNDTSVCSPATVILNATTSGATYHWQDNSALSTYTVTQSGNYSVTVSASGCNYADTIQVDVHSLPNPTVSSANPTICANDSAQVCAPSGFFSYIWNTGAITNCIHTSLAGNYYVTVTDNNGCSASSNHLAITVHPMPPVSISVNGDTLSAYNAVSYQWYLNGNPVGNGTSVFIANQSGSYTVQVTDSNGCVATSNAVIFTGISDLSHINSELNIYPNPNSTGTWQLKAGEGWIGSKLEVLDAEGRLVFNSEIRSPNSELSFEAARGVYILRIINAQGGISVKLIKW